MDVGQRPEYKEVTKIINNDWVLKNQDYIETKNLNLNSIYNILFSFTEPHVVNRGLIKILSRYFSKKKALLFH